MKKNPHLKQSVHIMSRFTPAEGKAIRQAAKQAKVSLGEYVRQCVLTK